jgi:hypothetical protein
MPITKASSSAVAPGAKGELVVGSATNDSAILAVGANDTVLTADSSTATGVKWATVSAGGWTELASGTLSGSSVSLTSISQDYQNLHLYIRGAIRTSAGGIMMVRVNSNTNNQYYSTWSGSATTVTLGSATNFWQFVNGANDMNTTANDYARIWTFYSYTQGSRLIVGSYGNEPNSGYNMNNMHRLDDTSGVTSIQLAPTSGTFNGGSYVLYGEK